MSITASAICRLCGRRVTSIVRGDANRYAVNCRTCGSYDADADAWTAFEDMSREPADRHLLSAMTRTAPIRGIGPVLIDETSFTDLREGRLPEKTFAEMRDALLDWIAVESEKDPRSRYGAVVKIDSTFDYPVAYCHTVQHVASAEWDFIFKPLMDKGLVAVISNIDGLFRLTDDGWERVEKKRTKTKGAQAFIAMAFRGMDHVHRAIADGIARAGYQSLRMDGDEYVGGVMDRVIGRIRESRFVVADFTHNRGGVYYEAGFAVGLGVPLISLCRNDHLQGDARIHFDVQHLNHLAWSEAQLDQLTERLDARIVALLGKGPFQPRRGGA